MATTNVISIGMQVTAVATTRPGALVGWKKCRVPGSPSGELTLVKLHIPAHADRICVNGKWRASQAYVLEGEGISMNDPLFCYAKNTWVEPRLPYDADPSTSYAAGIHFFLSKEVAEKYFCNPVS